MSWRKELLHSLVEEQNGLNGTFTTSLNEHSILYQVAKQVANGSLIDQHHRSLHELREKSHKEMGSARLNSDLLAWRRLFTDASIIESLLYLNSSTALQSISLLDHAIIIAGAAGDGRQDLIHSIIARIQSTFFPCPTFKNESCFDSQRISCNGNISLDSSQNPILSLVHPPSFVSFETRLSERPFILRGFANDWPAMHDHPWNSAQYLRSISGCGRVVPVEVGCDYRRDNWKPILMDWDEFLTTLNFPDQPCRQRQNDTIYLAQYDLTKQFPALRNDIIIPDYAYVPLTAPSEYAEYRPPENEEQLVLNVWLGPKGTVTPAHTDPYFNLYVQVVGCKTVWLAPPNMSPYMTSTHHDHDPKLCNTSIVDVFKNDGSPEFCDNVVPKAMSATLMPGDLLFFPPGWWHAMRSEETSFSVSFWF